MSPRPLDALPTLLESFFRDYLERVRGASPYTIRAYRDALRLFFTFLGSDTKRAVAHLRLEDLRVERVLAFLVHLETRRGNAVVTRNCRLAALRAFFSHLLRHDPTRAEQYHRVLALPSKKVHPPLATYLEPEEVRILLEQPDRSLPTGCRDHALLLVLYNTGARVSEALALRVDDLQLVPPRQVRLHGKGGKDRLCPIWRDTASALHRLMRVRTQAPAGLVFCNARGQPLTRDGVAYLLDKYVGRCHASIPTIKRRRITPHVLRHSCAVALLQAGVDITVIRDYLGHASVATTNRYVATNLKMKREVLDAFWKRAGISSPRSSKWQPTPDLLRVLSSL